MLGSAFTWCLSGKDVLMLRATEQDTDRETREAVHLDLESGEKRAEVGDLIGNTKDLQE